MANPIYTIGYGSRSLAELVELLLSWGLRLLADVRSQPYSRHNPDFSQRPLAAAALAHGIAYRFLGDSLGGRPTDPECLTDGAVDYGKVRAQPFFHEGIDQLLFLGEAHVRAAILCAEEKPESCHRTLLIAPALLERDVPVLHITETGELETHDQLLRRIAKGQRQLFDVFPPPLPPPRRVTRRSGG